MNRGRITHWLSDGQYDLCFKLGKKHPKISDLIFNIQDRLIERPGLWLLCKLFGHLVYMDQCGRPEHDYCFSCGKSMPGQAQERGGRT